MTPLQPSKHIEALSEQLAAQQEAFDARLAALEQLAAGVPAGR